MAQPAPASAPAPPQATPRTVPILGCDGFLLALDSMMRRSGQGSHVSQSIALLASTPDAKAMTKAWRELIHAHPITVAKLGRSLRSLLPVWRVPAKVREDQVPPIRFWHEPGMDGPFNTASDEVPSLAELCRRFLNPDRGARRPEHWVHLNILAHKDGTCSVLVTWCHLLLDGKGVELLLTELSRRCDGDGTAIPSVPTPDRTKAPEPMKKRMERAKKFIEHFQSVMKTRFSSLGGNKPKPSAFHCKVVALDEAQSKQVLERAAAMSSQLINTPFFFAAAARAHDAVFKARGRDQESQLVSMPVQVRPKGTNGPMFQNYVSILFFRLLPEELTSMEAATGSIVQQFQQMMRNRLDLSFSAMQDLMRRIPPRPYMGFLRLQMKGEVASFFHSHTGPFAPQMKHMAGADMAMGYHLPVISTPPGTGLFVNEFGPRLSLQMSWRDGALSEAERGLMFERFLHDLIDGPPQNLTTLLEV